MCLDVGEKRIGVALSDPLFITAQGIETYECVGPVKDIEYFCLLAKQRGADTFLLGLPKNMNGTEGFKAEEVREFGSKLAQRSKLKVEYFDERLTTRAAENVLLEADISRKKRKKVIDKMAAVIILQSYLDTKH